MALSRNPGQLDEKALAVIQVILVADVLVTGVPTYQASYPGMFKHLFGMIDPHAMAGKPVILAATGGSERHALKVEHQLRPLLNYFRTATVATAIYAASSEYNSLELRDASMKQRILRAVDELKPLMVPQYLTTQASETVSIIL
ncbi:NAD(P)H-dependent oxidoreductase (plasmid) [Pantoea sp. C3]|uniref:NAD(P)H-dependent oxidoreductase n=1 Tax=Pantoea phytostimulans TaxID=2769024 RepID=UPI0038F6854F